MRIPVFHRRRRHRNREVLAAQAGVVARKGQDLAARAADLAQERLEVAADVAARRGQVLAAKAGEAAQERLDLASEAAQRRGRELASRAGVIAQERLDAAGQVLAQQRHEAGVRAAEAILARTPPPKRQRRVPRFFLALGVLAVAAGIAFAIYSWWKRQHDDEEYAWLPTEPQMPGQGPTAVPPDRPMTPPADDGPDAPAPDVPASPARTGVASVSSGMNSGGMTARAAHASPVSAIASRLRPHFRSPSDDAHTLPVRGYAGPPEPVRAEPPTR